MESIHARRFLQFRISFKLPLDYLQDNREGVQRLWTEESRIIGSIPEPFFEFLPPINYNFRFTTPCSASEEQRKVENFLTSIVHIGQSQLPQP